MTWGAKRAEAAREKADAAKAAGGADADKLEKLAVQHEQELASAKKRLAELGTKARK